MLGNITLTLQRLRQKNHEFRASLDYTETCCLKTKQKEKLRTLGRQRQGDLDIRIILSYSVNLRSAWVT